MTNPRTRTLALGVLALGILAGGAGYVAADTDTPQTGRPVLAASASSKSAAAAAPSDATTSAAPATRPPADAGRTSSGRPSVNTESVSVTYSSEIPANWSVIGVAADDVLNIRAEPGARSQIVGRLGPDHEGIDSTGRTAMVGNQRWREVKVPGATTGWVAARYLAEM